MRMCTLPTTPRVAAAVVGLFASVSSAQAVTINLSSATGAPGSTVTIQATLSTAGAQVGGVINNIVFDPETLIVDCQINPALNLSAWKLLPDGCVPGFEGTTMPAALYQQAAGDAVATATPTPTATPGPCKQARFVIVQFSSQSIPNGTLLYTCTIHIAANAPAQVFPLVCASPSGSTPDPPSPLTVDCPNSQVQVVLPTPTRTPNPATSGGGGSGCQIALRRGPDAHWPLSMSAVAALWAWRRHRRRKISAVDRLAMIHRSR